MKKREGFSLSELILGVAILAFTLGSLLSLFIHCYFLNEISRNLNVATSHASSILEYIRSQPFFGLEEKINNGEYNYNNSEIFPLFNYTLNNETITTSVTQTGNPLGIKVRVSWLERTNRTRFLDLETLTTDY
ncbi:MAG: hypothetical protein NC900_03080 [Candidatus Omnitrophica bacterium]|nr:hypothetical protein [Candidatus Omnitrophota bacterium]MCM8799702.1 hypothetical protein [Candidatus Omnitrophota bacterium]